MNVRARLLACQEQLINLLQNVSIIFSSYDYFLLHDEHETKYVHLFMFHYNDIN